MAPMTRCRTDQPGNIPNLLMADYYAQRASAGLIITEATQISDDSQGYSFTPGVYTSEQIRGWQQVTTAVHNAGGVIFNQLWHVGRVSHPYFQKGRLPMAPSAIKPVDTHVWIAKDGQAGEMVECVKPRGMNDNDIQQVINDFAIAAEKAVEAGFDGIEIHGGNGYLIDQFLRTNSNHRSDNYGGNRENRLRFLMEVVDAVAARIGTERIGVRLAPYVTFKDMNCPDIVPTILQGATQLNQCGIAYIHLSEADWDDAPVIPTGFREQLRESFDGTIIVAGRYTRESAEQVLDKGYADLVAFGRDFIANPDLPYRLKNKLPLADFDQASLFGGDHKGYSDYTVYQA